MSHMKFITVFIAVFLSLLPLNAAAGESSRLKTLFLEALEARIELLASIEARELAQKELEELVNERNGAVHVMQETGTIDNSPQKKRKRDCELEVKIARGNFLVARRAEEAADSAYVEILESINSATTFADLVGSFEDFSLKLMRELKSSSSRKLTNLAHLASIASYVMQLKHEESSLRDVDFSYNTNEARFQTHENILLSMIVLDSAMSLGSEHSPLFAEEKESLQQELKVIELQIIFEKMIELASKEREKDNALDYEALRQVIKENFVRKSFCYRNYMHHAILAMHGKRGLKRKPLAFFIERLEKYELSETITTAIALIKSVAISDTPPPQPFLPVGFLELRSPVFVNELTSYVQIDSPRFAQSIFLPISTIFQLIAFTTEQHFKDLDGLYEAEEAAHLPHSAAALARYLASHVPQPLALPGIRPPLKDERFARRMSTNFARASFASWEIGFDSDYYVKLTGGHEHSPYWKYEHGDSYAEMAQGLQTRDFPQKIRDALRGIRVPTDEKDADNARLYGAKFISEPARNWRIWLINMMLLDLVEDQLINWDDFMRIHPMQGGSFAHQEGAGESKKRDQIQKAETLVAVNWLMRYWPFAAEFKLVSERPATIDEKDLPVLDSLEEYFRKVIGEMFFHRAHATSLWEKRYMPTEYLFSGRKKQPYRICDELVVFSTMDAAEEERIRDQWAEFDRAEIKMLSDEKAAKRTREEAVPTVLKEFWATPRG